MTKNNIYHLFIKIFLCIYPFFLLKDTYNSYFTLIQIMAIFILFFWNLIINKDSRKKIKYLIIYFIIVIFYETFHHMNAINFTSLVPGNFNYNMLQECLQLLKMSTPAIFIYTIYYSNLNKKDYLDIIKSWLLIICGSIIITNISKISLGSYNDLTIKGNIFEWFSKKYIYNEIASKGFFMYANQISCLLVILIPIVMYYFLKKELKGYYLIILMLSLLMLGTRISNIASILVFIGMTLIYFFLNILNKEKQDWKLLIINLIIIITYVVILPFSPTFSRYEIYDYLLDKPRYIVNNDNTNIEDIKYIEDNYEYKLINEYFIKNSYPYQYDPIFWLKIMNEPINKRTDFRHLEIEMVKRVKEINNNKFDTLLGITNVRIQNIFNIERDYILQYYAFGIIGCLLFLVIYIFILIRNIINIMKEFGFFNISILGSTILLLFIAYLSGNIFNQIAIFIPSLIIISLKMTAK